MTPFDASAVDAGPDAGPTACVGGACRRVTAISAGAEFVCAVLSDGSVDCWGNGLLDTPGAPSSDGNALSSTPEAVAGLTGVTAIAPGDGVACALLSGGAVQCLGNNIDGQLGNGTTTSSSTPVPVSGVSSATAVSVGAGFACALLSDGSVDCWGGNANGALGNGTFMGTPGCGRTCIPTPTAVPGLSGVVAISASATGAEGFACALLSDGSVDCWGNNNNGQLGNGGTASTPTPTPVPGLTGVTAISAGGADVGGFVCALLSGGTVTCWGDSSYGSGYSSHSVVPVAVPGLSSVTAIAAGYYFACALLSGGTVTCWGDDDTGQLGYGVMGNAPTIPGLSGVTAIAAGGSSVGGFACALLSDGSVKCWGASPVVPRPGSSTPVTVTW
jgi:alpha-tubulin suppressor-like RCC1 family protein